jgi:uncharacterized protein (DUF488 family)
VIDAGGAAAAPLHPPTIWPVEEAIGTIGVYGRSIDEFGADLRRFGADAVVDVRQRRGVRGAEYAWANHRRLEQWCADHGVAYAHCPVLAPTTALRESQYAVDAAAGVGKRDRTRLSPEYEAAYSRLLDERDALEQGIACVERYRRPVLLCVEAEAAACHRSIAASRLADQTGRPIQHL